MPARRASPQWLSLDSQVLDAPAGAVRDNVEIVYFRGDDVLYDVPPLVALSSTLTERAKFDLPVSTPIPTDIVRLADPTEAARALLVACDQAHAVNGQTAATQQRRPRWYPRVRAVWCVDPLRFVRGIADWSNIQDWTCLHEALAEARRSAGAKADALPPACTMLVGHSHGGAVVSRLLHERAKVLRKGVAAEGASALARSVVAAFYVDAGSNVPGEAHVTDGDVARFNAETSAHAVTWQNGIATRVDTPPAAFRVTVVGTPRQWRDARRAFVEEEKDAMLHAFEIDGALAPVEQKVYWTPGGFGNLEEHFTCLTLVDFGA